MPIHVPGPKEGAPTCVTTTVGSHSSACGRLLRAWTVTRTQSTPRPVEVMPSFELGVTPVPMKIGPLRSVRFNLQLSLRGGGYGVQQKRPWPLTRDAWWKVNLWASQLRVDPGMRPDDRPSLIEALISFILCNKGDRLETGLGEEQGGHTIATQLSHFRSALLSFQHLTTSEALLSDPPEDMGQGCWLQRLGFGRQIRLSLPVHVPKWGEARKNLYKAPESFSMAPVDMPHAAMWRRWIFGGPGTQMHGGQSSVSTPLWKVPTKRHKVKATVPQWQQQCFKARAFLSWAKLS